MSESEPLPQIDWPNIIINSNIIGDISDNYEDCREKLIEYYERRYEDGFCDLETSHSAAIGIGGHAKMNHEGSFESIFENDLDSDCEKELAKGYIGARVIEDAT